MQTASLAKRVWQDPIYFIAFGFGTGLMPFAPGTWGTLAAIPLFLLLMGVSPVVYLFIVIAAFILGVWVSESVSRDLAVHDFSGIVWDEVVGYLLTMFMVPATFTWIISGFILFRFFDILKPWPIRYIDKHVHGGLGIMLDDILAAIPAWIILQLLMKGFA